MRYVAGRAGQALLSIAGVSVIVFVTLRLSGDPSRLLVPDNATAEDVARVRHELGLDEPIWVQFGRYLAGLVQGDLGYSYVQHRPAFDLIMERLPFTIDLAIAALLLSLVVGIPTGMISALYRNRLPERLLMPMVLVGQSMPAFWTGILLILLLSVRFQLLPSTGVEGVQSLIMPAITLASLSMATMARITRSSFLEQLDQDYVRTARAKGVGTGRLLGRHLLRNASIPIVTLAGLELASLLGGAVITETIFAWPGIGQLTVQSIEARDFPVVQAIVLFVAIVYIVVNLLIDLLYGLIDPRASLVTSEAGA
ncbi:MAG: ABC transporter permease subunit [Streptosporangiales bacterium]|nr:ABC transporter permease subunit [Streptosporangiales bacterium]